MGLTARLVGLLLLVLHLSTHASASLMAVDLGSEYLKVCLVKPGKTPISMVVNEMSRRKSPALIGLVDQDRVLGEEAYSLGVRYPHLIFSELKNLLGRSSKDAEVQRLLANNTLPYEVVDHPQRGTCAIQVNDTASFLVEELVAGILQYAKQITDSQAGESVIDTVITVPAWFGVAQRQALLDAANLAGLNVLGLINTHSAAALQYGIERDFSSKEQTVILYDMGSGSTETALVKYSTYGKAGGSSSSKGLINQFEVLDVEWDHSLGSNTLDLLLAKHFAEEFKQQGGDDVMSVPKAMAKLRRQVRRTKEILSANSAAPMSVEELHAGKDFQSSIKREVFEAMAEDFWQRAAAPLSKLLARNKLKPSDVDAVELLGGGSRVPKLQAVLSEALGGRHLDRHLDADEAVVLGAGLFAANLSSSFRLRKFGMTDVAVFGVSFESNDLFVPAAPPIDPATATSKKAWKGKATKAAEDAEADGATASGKSGHVVKSLLPAGKKLPIKRAIKYSNLTIDGFSFDLHYNTSTVHGLPPGVEDPQLASFQVSGIQDAIKRYNSSGVTTLRFEADYSSLLHFSIAECVVEVSIVEDKVIEVQVPVSKVNETGVTAMGDANSSKSAAPAADAAKEAAAEHMKDGATDGAEQKDKNDAAEMVGSGTVPPAAGNDTTGSSVNKTVTVKKTIQVPRRKTFHVGLAVSGAGPRHPPLAGDVFAAARSHIAAWRAAEVVKAATAKAKNDLEAYIISTREKLETDENLRQVTVELDRVKLIEQLTEAEDWLYGDGEHEAAEAFRTKLAGLKATGDPMVTRANELELRPQVLSAVKEQFEAAEKIVTGWAGTKPWITEHEAMGMTDKIKEFKKWLQQQIDAQAEKSATEDPAFSSVDVASKWEAVQKALTKMDSKRIPRPAPAAKSAAAPKGEEGEPANSNGDKTESLEDAEADSGPGGGQAKQGSAGGQQQQQKPAGGPNGSQADSSLPGVEEQGLPVHEEL